MRERERVCVYVCVRERMKTGKRKERNGSKKKEKNIRNEKGKKAMKES